MTHRIWLVLSVASLGTSPAWANPGILPRLPEAVVRKLLAAQPPAAPAVPAEPTDPAKLAERIGENTRAAGERLREKDAGTDTQATQAEILRDIDELLKSAQNPPPPMGGGGSPPPMPPTDPPMDPMGGGQGDTPPPPREAGQKPPMGGGGQPMPMSGDQPMPGKGQSGSGKPMPMPGQPGGEQGKGGPKSRPSWRDRAEGDEPGDEGKPTTPRPMPMGPPTGQTPGGGGGPLAPKSPAMPAEDAVAKQVWGHLPERLRQEMKQYYKEQFMPKYSDLLRQYYSSLADQDKGTRK